MTLTWQQHQQNIFAGESGGDYDALFGYQNRPDGIFSGIKVSEMPIADVIKFTSPTGAYGQYVKGQVGRVATPVGAYQVVGSTLRGAVEALGLDPSQKFDKATQDKIGQYILKTQGTGAWEGYGKGGAAMAQEPQQPQGLLGGLLGGQGIGGALGMSDDFRDKLKMAILAGTGDARMDPLIRATAARMEERRGEAKEQRQRNKSLEYLKQLADAGDAMAGQIYGAVSTGVLPVGAGLSTYLTQSFKGQKVTDTTDYKNYLEFKKTNPDITFEEFYTTYKNKPDIQNKGVYRDKSGNIIGEVNFDKTTGQFFQFDPNGQRQVLDMKELTPVTDATFAKTIPSYDKFVDLSEELQSDVGSMRQLEKYMTAINNTNEGFARLADDLSASAKTLLGSYIGSDYASLSPEELNLRISRGLQQGLIGRFRIETVGGGVMTEQDALRIIQNLGGDVSLLQNKEVVAKQIQNLFEAKKSSFDRKKKQYDIALNQIYRDQGFEEIEPYKFDESVFNLKGDVGSNGSGARVFPNAPPVGTISKGHRFKGGDPSIQSNWEPI